MKRLSLLISAALISTFSQASASTDQKTNPTRRSMRKSSFNLTDPQLKQSWRTEEVLRLGMDYAFLDKWCDVHEVIECRINKLQEYHAAQEKRKETNYLMYIDAWCTAAKKLHINMQAPHPQTHKTLFDLIEAQNNRCNGLYARTFPRQWAHIIGTFQPVKTHDKPIRRSQSY